MNEYRVPICSVGEEYVWIESITAKSVADCQEKLMNTLIEEYELDDCLTYREFKKLAAKNGIIIGEIKDLEEL